MMFVAEANGASPRLSPRREGDGGATMAHGLLKPSDMAFYGETPWHGLGECLDEAMSLDQAREHRLIKWTVAKEPVFLADGGKVPACHAIVRGDTRDVLGTVGDRYTLVQNSELLSIIEPVISGNSGVIHTLGNLFGGAKVWLLVQLPGEVDVTGHGDISGKFLLLSTTHDGSGKIRARFTSIRVVCWNTLSAALAGSSALPEVALRHTNNVHDRLAQAASMLGLANRYHAELDEALASLARKPMTASQTYGYVNEVMSDVFKSAQEGKVQTRARNILDKVYSLAETGRGADLPGVRGTMWGALNMITEYVDHGKGYHSHDSALDNVAFQGDGMRLKQRAMEVALAW